MASSKKAAEEFVKRWTGKGNEEQDKHLYWIGLFQDVLGLTDALDRLKFEQTVLDVSGSVEPENIQARFRNPLEIGWGFCVKFDHEFIGRAALEEYAKNPKRDLCTIVLNVDDMCDVFRSQFEPGEEYKIMEFPFATPMPAGGEANYVRDKDGKVVGIATTAVYSYYYRCMIAHAVIDIDQKEIGNELIFQWGDYGKRIKDIRCTVERYPLIDLPTNKDYDLSTVPYGFEE